MFFNLFVSLLLCFSCLWGGDLLNRSRSFFLMIFRSTLLTICNVLLALFCGFKRNFGKLSLKDSRETIEIK